MGVPGVALPLRLGEATMASLAEHRTLGLPLVALVPVGSVEPHGPHLPLDTDTRIGDAAAERAARRLRDAGIAAVVAPPVGYGVTDFAAGFAGAVSLPAEALTPFLRAVVLALRAAGMDHVCLVSNHLEPAHDAAVRAAIAGLPAGAASVASPLTRRWARTLSAEFKSGACHAGRYETSIVLAAGAPVDVALTMRLPAIDISLSDGIRAGKTGFADMGMTDAYTGDPASATAAEGRELLDRLAEMIDAEVTEGLAARADQGGAE